MNKDGLHVFCDMDGVLANHDKQATEFGVKLPRDENSEEGFKYEISDYHNDFFLTMPTMPDFAVLEEWMSTIPHNQMHVLSAVPKRRTSALSVYDEKKQWVKDKMPWFRTRNIHIVFREHKQLFPREYRHAILIDDNKSNIYEWRAAGGIGILHLNAKESVRKASQVFNVLQSLII